MRRCGRVGGGGAGSGDNKDVLGRGSKRPDCVGPPRAKGDSINGSAEAGSVGRGSEASP